MTIISHNWTKPLDKSIEQNKKIKNELNYGKLANSKARFAKGYGR